MTVVWPMTPARWRSYRNATSQEEPYHFDMGVAGQDKAGSPELDCWKSMGGRPEAWYLVCCDMNWSGCWGGDFTSEICCQQIPGTKDVAAADPNHLRKFLDFSDEEFALFLQALGSNFTEQQAGRGRFRCLSPMDCAKEGFARFYQASWDAGILPLRHPWFVDMEDHLIGVIWKMRAENRGAHPAGHEHTFERLQMAKFLRHVSKKISPDQIPREEGPQGLPLRNGKYSSRKDQEIDEIVNATGCHLQIL